VCVWGGGVMAPVLVGTCVGEVWDVGRGFWGGGGLCAAAEAAV